MKYRLTPFNVLAILALGYAVFFELNFDTENTGLGGLFAGVTFFFIAVIIVLNLIIQSVLEKKVKLLYTIELIGAIGLIAWIVESGGL